jgi:hypothetical protein
MTPKPPKIERELVLANDDRRRYGAQVKFTVRKPLDLGHIDSVTLLLPSGKIATLSQQDEDGAGVAYQFEIEGFAKASEAEVAGRSAVQAVLLSAVSLNFDVRLHYPGYEPALVYDRIKSAAFALYGSITGYAGWNSHIVADHLIDSFEIPLHDRRTLLAMELLCTSGLEANERTRFVMAVSAFEPLAQQLELGSKVSDFVDNMTSELDCLDGINDSTRSSLHGRIQQLKRESVRQALLRLCDNWFPGDRATRNEIDRLYRLRSEILHEGRLADQDINLGHERKKAVRYLRQIISKIYGISLRSQ